MPASLIRRTDLDPGAKVLWAVLADYARMDGDVCAWPGQRRLRADMGVGGWLLARWIDQLVDVGALEVEPGVGRRSSRYTPLDPSRSAPPTGAQTNHSAPPTQGANSTPLIRSAPLAPRRQARKSAVAPRPLPGIIRKERENQRSAAHLATESPKPSSPKVREPNLIWDAIAKLFYPSGIAPGQRKHVGALTRDFKSKGATPEEMEARIERYHREWPDCACTPNALLEHWDTFGPKPRPSWMPEPKKGVGEQ